MISLLKQKAKIRTVQKKRKTYDIAPIFKKHIDKSSSDAKLVRVGKTASIILAVFSIFVAPFKLTEI